ncbi:hypothetical protein ACWPSR_003787 [Cronobacter turicensis]
MYNNLPVLMENILYTDSLVNSYYSSLEENTISEALNEYRLRIDDLIKNGLNEDEQSPLNIYLSGGEQIYSYKHGLLSMDKVILDDVLYEISLRNNNSTSDVMLSPFIQEDKQEKIDLTKKAISNFISFIKNNFELIRAGFIAFSRSNSMLEEAERKGKIFAENADRNFIYSFLPREVATMYERKLKVQPIRRLANTNKIKFVSEKTLPPEIMLEITDCESSYVNGYMYQSIVDSKLKDDRTFDFRLVLGKHENKRSYDSWVQGAVNRTIFFHYNTLMLNLKQSYAYGASLGTSCPFYANVLKKIDAQNNVSRRMIDVNIPFLDGLTPTEIFRIRTDYEDSFLSFRKVLRDTSYEIERSQSKKDIDLINKQFNERIMDEGLSDVKEKLKEYKRKSIKDFALETTPLIIGYLAAPSTTTLTVGAFGLLKNIYDVWNDSGEVKRHPSYFILKSLKK